MSKQVIKQLPELVNAKVITEEDAGRIRSYYAGKPSQSHSRLLVVFGILGALLVGLGIILIVAHNWDMLSRPTKTVFAFLPLVTGQVLCGYTLWKRSDSAVWRESTSVFLFFSVSSSIALIGQIYNISNDLADFLLAWALLTLPLFYVMRSSITSLLFIWLITWLVCEDGLFDNWNQLAKGHIAYLALMPFSLLYYWLIFRSRPSGNYFHFHSWVIALSLPLALSVFSRSDEEYINIGYMALFSIFCILGRTRFFSEQHAMANAYLITGSAGMLIQLLFFSFADAWDGKGYLIGYTITNTSVETYAAILLSIAAVVLLIALSRKKGWSRIHPSEYSILLYFPAAIIGAQSQSAAALIINLFLLGMGLYTIWQGAKADHLGILNYGLVIITLLVICRFFDTDLSFVLRGIMFLAVGGGFFAANYLMLKRRKQTEAQK
jgi:uncharacterized membrane protein